VFRIEESAANLSGLGPFSPSFPKVAEYSNLGLVDATPSGLNRPAPILAPIISEAAGTNNQRLRRPFWVRVLGLLLDYWGRLRRRLHSPRTERMTEKSAVTPIARSVQTKKKCPLELPTLLVTPTPFPFMWM